MTKFLIVLLAAVGMANVSQANPEVNVPADTLYLLNREKQVVEVKQVFPDKINYWKEGTSKKDIRTLPISQIAQIVYSNGTRDEFNVVADQPQGQPQPAIQWLTQVGHTDKQELSLTACVQNKAQGMKVEVNGVESPINVRGFKPVAANDCAGGVSVSHTVRLREGQNTVVFVATNSAGTTRSVPLAIMYEKAQKRVALIIGNSSYSAANKLPNPINDAKAMSQKLRGLGFDVIERYDTRQGELRTAVAQFGSSLQDQNVEVALFYYAGHGMQVAGKNYLIPVDITPQSESELKVLAVAADEVLDQMNNENNTNRTNLMILDACRDNPLARSWTRSTGGKGLANMGAPAGTLIAFSTRPGQTAQDGDGSNSPYTAELLKALDEPQKRLEDIFKTVRVRVMELTHSQQIPMENSLLTQELILNKSGKK
ncbi:caspase family protein [Telluribacter humicola]|uniref:caspase family protein n=1 Tax=Telluribacter humicola TaxID=1720261 RepID=UPI001A956659|nr:caspase domain-containing protein [Telluribacter humicola]